MGLALWGTGDDPALSLIPAELRERQQYQQALAASAAALVALAVGLGGVSLARDHAAYKVAGQIRAENVQAASLQAIITRIQPSATIHAELLTRHGHAVQALSGDIDWVDLLHRMETALLAGVTIDSLSVSRSTATAGSGTASTSSGPAVNNNNIGQVTMSLTTTKGAPSVAEFVREMWDVPGLDALWVSTAGSGQTGNTMTFTATANVTTKALSDRVAALPGSSLPGLQP